MTLNQLSVIRLLYKNRKGLFASEIHHITEVQRSSIYTMLLRLIVDGYVVAITEPATPQFNMPRERYVISKKGISLYEAVIKEHCECKVK